MYKEYEGISTRGLRNEKTMGLNLLNEMWNSAGKNLMHFDTINQINKVVYDQNYKTVDERLIPLIGVYELPPIAEPYWADDFITLLTKYTIIDNLLVAKHYKVVNTTVTTGEFYDMLEDLTNRLKKANYIEGTVQDKSNRNVKILKYIKQQLNKFIDIPDAEFEKEEFVLHYNKYKESKKNLYLVITNSIASILGMSSYAPFKSATERLWSSCMSVRNGDSFSTSIFANILDSNSLLCYVTDGNPVQHLSFNKEKYMHTAMISRTHLRLLTEPTGDNPTIVIDRNYPSSMYAEAIYTKVAELVKKYGLSLGMFVSYNQQQGGKDYFLEMKNKFIKDCDTQLMQHANKMLTVLSYNCNNNCSNCGLRKTNINNMNICGACSRSGSCKKAKCYKCPDFSRSPVIQGQAYYDDQGGSAIIQSQYCQKVYDVYMNIEKNIEIYKKDGDA